MLNSRLIENSVNSNKRSWVLRLFDVSRIQIADNVVHFKNMRF